MHHRLMDKILQSSTGRVNCPAEKPIRRDLHRPRDNTRSKKQLVHCNNRTERQLNRYSSGTMRSVNDCQGVLIRDYRTDEEHARLPFSHIGIGVLREASWPNKMDPSFKATTVNLGAAEHTVAAERYFRYPHLRHQFVHHHKLHPILSAQHFPEQAKQFTYGRKRLVFDEETNYVASTQQSWPALPVAVVYVLSGKDLATFIGYKLPQITQPCSILQQDIGSVQFLFDSKHMRENLVPLFTLCFFGSENNDVCTIQFGKVHPQRDLNIVVFTLLSDHLINNATDYELRVIFQPLQWAVMVLVWPSACERRLLHLSGYLQTTDSFLSNFSLRYNLHWFTYYVLRLFLIYVPTSCWCDSMKGTYGELTTLISATKSSDVVTITGYYKLRVGPVTERRPHRSVTRFVYCHSLQSYTGESTYDIHGAFHISGARAPKLSPSKCSYPVSELTEHTTIIIDGTTSVVNTDASLPYSRNLSESHILEKITISVLHADRTNSDDRSCF
ncbi:hypothetical protein CLF_109362 [Clonorchis sinensis]|uniref:Uncharacterized protein n=1 Tax=Clonorchis sinensis TaxID=79923 RepID=G7YSI6_CLOSI|nr:hypothetical protein CLF_109362 [Clonorchis sinensis]